MIPHSEGEVYVLVIISLRSRGWSSQERKIKLEGIECINGYTPHKLSCSFNIKLRHTKNRCSQKDRSLFPAKTFLVNRGSFSGSFSAKGVNLLGGSRV